MLATADPALADWIGELRATHRRADGTESENTRLRVHLDRYTACNTFDYFIHKDFGTFLRRELDFYVKNEVMHLDDIENGITILAEEIDPNKLHDLKAALDGTQLYAPAQIDRLVALYLSGADRDRLDPILDACVADYRERLDEDAQVDFKGKAKAIPAGLPFSVPGPVLQSYRVEKQGEHDKALACVMTAVLKDDPELFKQFMDNESFRRWMADTVFGLT